MGSSPTGPTNSRNVSCAQTEEAIAEPPLVAGPLLTVVQAAVLLALRVALVDRIREWHSEALGIP